jgi:hypothetical protein
VEFTTLCSTLSPGQERASAEFALDNLRRST